MQFIQPFRQFDPINGELHKKTPPVIKHYLRIAREILVNRSYDEIEYAISTVNYLLEGGRELLTKSNNDKETSNKEIETISIEEAWDLIHSESRHFTPTALLYDIYCSFDVEIDSQEDLKNASWAEYFAVLALAEIAELQETDISSIHVTELSSRSAEIGEAIAYAKAFVELDSNSSKSAQYVLSIKGKKAAIERHRETNELKGEYIHWFYAEYLPGKEESEVNFSEAARQFYRLRIQPICEHEPNAPYEYDDNVLRMLKTALREQRRRRKEL